MCFEACYGIHTGGFNPSEKIFVKLDHLARQGWKMNNAWNQHRVTTIFVRLVLGCYHLISITRLGGCALFHQNARQHVHLSQWVGDLNRYFGPMRFGWLVFLHLRCSSHHLLTQEVSDLHSLTAMNCLKSYKLRVDASWIFMDLNAATLLIF